MTSNLGTRHAKTEYLAVIAPVQQYRAIHIPQRQHCAPHQSLFSEHDLYVPALQRDRGMTDGELEIVAYPQVQVRDVYVLMVSSPFFTL
jgi:hypothetical protein